MFLPLDILGGGVAWNEGGLLTITLHMGRGLFSGDLLVLEESLGRVDLGVDLQKVRPEPMSTLRNTPAAIEPMAKVPPC